MPVSFNFTNNETGEAISLNTIDEEMCKYFNVEVNKDNYCGPFLDARGAGMVAGRDTGDGKVTKESFAKYIEEDNAAWDEYMIPFFKKFLYEKYTYRSWR